MAAQQAGGLVAVGDAELAAGPVAVGVDRGFRHAELAGDLLGAQMLVDEAQAFALALRKQLDGILGDVGAWRHGKMSKRRLSGGVYFKAKAFCR